jgi:hypothetical protein
VDKQYCVVFLSLIENEKDFQQEMSKLGVAPPMIEQIISKAPVILKGGLTLEDAERYAEAIEYAGGRVKVQEHGSFEEQERINTFIEIKPLESFTMCPECGFKQLKGEACVKCGLVFREGETFGKKGSF